jgi:hypothetical protein
MRTCLLPRACVQDGKCAHASPRIAPALRDRQRTLVFADYWQGLSVPKTAQTLARYSAIRLMLGVCTHVGLHDQTAAIGALSGTTEQYGAGKRGCCTLTPRRMWVLGQRLHVAFFIDFFSLDPFSKIIDVPF